MLLKVQQNGWDQKMHSIFGWKNIKCQMKHLKNRPILGWFLDCKYISSSTIKCPQSVDRVKVTIKLWLIIALIFEYKCKIIKVKRLQRSKGLTCLWAAKNTFIKLIYWCEKSRLPVIIRIREFKLSLDMNVASIL